MGHPRATATTLTVAAVLVSGCSPLDGTYYASPTTPLAGMSMAQMKKELAAIPGVASVELTEVNNFDWGYYQQASLEVGSRNKNAAVRVADRAMAILWQGPRESDKRVSVWTEDATGNWGLADESSVDEGLRGPDYKETMTRRYGPWPGRGVPPTTSPGSPPGPTSTATP